MGYGRIFGPKFLDDGAGLPGETFPVMVFLFTPLSLLSLLSRGFGRKRVSPCFRLHLRFDALVFLFQTDVLLLLFLHLCPSHFKRLLRKELALFLSKLTGWGARTYPPLPNTACAWIT